MTHEKTSATSADTLYFSGPTWPVAAESIDLVLCTEVLEHVFDPEQLLAEAYRCLRPGGRLFLSVPFSMRWHFIPHDYWRYTPSSLRLLLQAAGFESVEIYGRGNEVTVACYKVMALMLPFLYPQVQSQVAVFVRRCVGLFLVPFFCLLAAIANLTLRYGRAGDDCLGYTAVATRPAAPPDSRSPAN